MKAPDEERARLDQLPQGRGRLLHPKSQLVEIGHPWEEGGLAPDTATVPAGQAPLLDNRKQLIELRNIAAARMTPEEVSDAVRRVAGWKPR